MTWHLPLPLNYIVSDDSQSFRWAPASDTVLPLLPHPGAFGFTRKHHRHEGIDLYCPPQTLVQAVEDGIVVAIEAFTGAHAGYPWWHDTFALLVEGESGVVVYGEIAKPELVVGAAITAGQKIGHVIPVLKTPKGRPDTMLHLELHDKGTRKTFEWPVRRGVPVEKPPSLRDPTPYLLEAVKVHHANRPRVMSPITLPTFHAE